MSAARSLSDAGISGRAAVMASAKSRANRAHWRRRSVVTRRANRSQVSVEVLRCMRMRMQRSARVSGRCPIAAMILGHQEEKVARLDEGAESSGEALWRTRTT